MDKMEKQRKKEKELLDQLHKIFYNNQPIFYFLGGIATIVGIVFIFNANFIGFSDKPLVQDSICPNLIKGNYNREMEFENWRVNFYNQNDKSSETEFTKARVKYLLKNECLQDLMEYTQIKTGVEKVINNYLEILDKKIIEEDICHEKYKEQERYLRGETLSEQFTFDKYPTKNTEPKELSELDLNSSRTARKFRTAISQQLNTVDFDGKYTIVGVGMTGWDGPVWIIDRTNGKAYEFPYHHYYFSLSYQENSNLLIVNSESYIKEMRRTQECYYMSITRKKDEMFMGYDLIPQYFLWTGDKFEYLGPSNVTPESNAFWEYYFRD
jgi:hypothetical protein